MVKIACGEPSRTFTLLTRALSCLRARACLFARVHVCSSACMFAPARQFRPAAVALAPANSALLNSRAETVSVFFRNGERFSRNGERFFRNGERFSESAHRFRPRVSRRWRR